LGPGFALQSGLKGLNALFQGFLLASRLGRHCFHRFEFLAGNQVLICQQAIDLLTHKLAQFLFQRAQRAKRTPGNAGKIVEGAVSGIHHLKSFG